MTIFDPGEKVEYLAAQCTDYDRYACHRYFLERVCVQGKYGLVCGDEADGGGNHSKVLLPPLYGEIRVCKISGPKALYDRYAVFVDGSRMADFTLVLNSWVACSSYRHN